MILLLPDQTFVNLSNATCFRVNIQSMPNNFFRIVLRIWIGTCEHPDEYKLLELNCKKKINITYDKISTKLREFVHSSDRMLDIGHFIYSNLE